MNSTRKRRLRREADRRKTNQRELDTPELLLAHELGRFIGEYLANAQGQDGRAIGSPEQTTPSQKLPP